MAIKWGNIIQGSKSTRQGKIGIEVTTSETDTQLSVTVKVYFASMYALSDTNNSYYFNEGKTASTLIGAKTIDHDVNTGSGWSSSNRTLLGTYTFKYNKGSSATTKYFSAKITGLDNLGSSNVSSVQGSVTVPALITYTISYDANGGSNAPSNQTKTHGKNITLSSTKPTRTGYTFLGWATSSSGSVVYSSGGTYSTNASVTLYAVWQANTYTISYDANGGENAPTSQTKTHDVALALSSTIPTRTYYIFLGWATYSNATSPNYQAGEEYEAEGNATLYAVWLLDYERPRVNNLTIVRCDADGTENEAGTNAKIKFDWQVDEESPSYQVYYKLTSASEYIGAGAIELSGTSGSVETVIADVTFDTDSAYNIQLNVADSSGYTATLIMLYAVRFPIDITEDGKSMSFGEPASEEDGILKVAFDIFDIAPKQNFLYHGENFFGGRLLWSGESLMNETHYIELDKPVSKMKNGILLVFSRNGTYNITPCFIPKESVAAFGRTSYAFPLVTSLFDYVGQKTIYVSDSKIEGHADNDATGTNSTSGITYHNEAFYLRYVYEV